MVMIVKDHEKKASGFISVTWITVRAHVSALPGPHGGAAMVYTGGLREATGSVRTPLRVSRLPRWKRPACHGGRRRPAAVTAGQSCSITGCPGRARVLGSATGRGWPWLTWWRPGEEPGRAWWAISGWKGIPAGRYYGG